MSDLLELFVDVAAFPTVPNDLSDNSEDWSEEKWAEAEAQEEAKEARKSWFFDDLDYALWAAEEAAAKVEAEVDSEARYWDEVADRLLAA